MLDGAIAAYRAATPASAALFARASTSLPAGVTSNVKFFPPYPIYLTRAKGSRVTDVDGREYVDYCLAFGPLVTGHGHPRVLDAIRAEIERAGTVIFGAPERSRGASGRAAARACCRRPRWCASRARAPRRRCTRLRLARGATGRSRVVKFEGHYHGVHDHVLWNLDRPLPQAAASDGIPRGDRRSDHRPAVRRRRRAHAPHSTTIDDVAAVIVEPIARGVIEPEPRVPAKRSARSPRRVASS